MTKLTIDAKRILVRLVGEQDAIFWPSRDPDQPWWPHRWILFWGYHKRGLPWRSRGRSAAAMKQSERSLKILTDAKLAKVLRPRTKSLNFILTETGDAIGRALANCNDPDDGLSTVTTLYELCPKPDWIPEIALNNNRGWGDDHSSELASIAFLALPALVAGWVECNSDSQRHVYYHLTESGFDIATGKVEPNIIGDLPEPLEDGFDMYTEATNRAYDELHAMTDRTSEIGEIPLPVSMPSYRKRKRKKK